MICLDEDSKNVNKYEIIFDKKKIKELKREIILNCSVIEHTEIETDCFPGFKDRDLIFNYTSDPVGKQEYFEETRTIYLHKFDEYIPPKLVEYIDQLLANNTEGIVNILDYNISCEYPNDNKLASSIVDEIEKKNDEYKKIPDEERKERIKKLQEIEELTEKQKTINKLLEEHRKNEKKLGAYYLKLMTLISLKLVDSLPLIDKRRVEAFYNIKIGYKEVKKEGKQKKKTK